MTERFEYLYHEYPLGLGFKEEVQRDMNIVGALGWKMIGFAGADKTLGLNKALAVYIRELPPLPSPGTSTPGWQADPLGRHQYRWWDGMRWGIDVSDNGAVAKDPPTPTSVMEPT
jgi:hypothetical protein